MAFLLPGFYAANGFAEDTQSPVGQWMVKDKTAHIRIENCGGKLWGVISWVQTPGTDEHNPDPSRRSRSVLGLPILLGLQPGENGRWNGDIYDADNGKKYKGGIRLVSENMLHVEGCIWGGIFCGGEDWMRIGTSDGSGDPPNAVCSRVE